jgi:hypothetical protein
VTQSLAQEHADEIGRLRLLVDIISPDEVGRAFAASLGSRDLAARSALGSYAIHRWLPDHALAPLDGTFATICRVCGWSRMPASHEALDRETAANWTSSRRALGGVVHYAPGYALYDLTEFRAAPAPLPDDSDWQRLRLILRTPTVLAPDGRAADLERALKSVFPSNKNERTVAIKILGYAGVFSTPGHASFFDRFLMNEEQELPHQRFVDWGYPMVWWRAKDGIREEAVVQWFPGEIAKSAV